MDNKKIYQMAKYIIFAAYIVVLVYFVFFAEMFGRTHVPTEYRYNLVPFKEINRFIKYRHQLGMTTVFINILGNIAAFMPFGVGLPIVTKRKAKFLRVLLCTFAFSLSIELIQLVSKVGSCDVDDLILNTIGGVLGYICYCFMCKCRNVRNNKV